VSHMSLAMTMPSGDGRECRADRRSEGIVHSYPLLVRSCLQRPLRLLVEPCLRHRAVGSFAGFGAAACAVWIAIGVGGAAWLGVHVAMAFGICWFLEFSSRRMDLGSSPAICVSHDRLWPMLPS